VKNSRGAALIMAMLTVALVATLAATAFWQQWRATEVETAELARLRAGWVLTAALDAGVALLGRDGRDMGHLSEAWASPLPETRLSAIPALGFTDAAEDVFLSRRISDLQGRLNVYNLIERGPASETGWAAFARLFERLSLPQAELAQLKEQLQASLDNGRVGDDAAVLLRPVRVRDLQRFGLSAQTLERLTPFVTWLPSRTTVNLNTAPAEVLYAAIPGLDAASEHKLVHFRAGSPFTSLGAVGLLLGPADAAGAQPALSDDLHGVSSRFFEISTSLRLGQTVLAERAVVTRSRSRTRVLLRVPVQQ
jgi:general secretion pathway protein K